MPRAVDQMNPQTLRALARDQAAQCFVGRPEAAVLQDQDIESREAGVSCDTTKIGEHAARVGEPLRIRDHADDQMRRCLHRSRGRRYRRGRIALRAAAVRRFGPRLLPSEIPSRPCPKRFVPIFRHAAAVLAVEAVQPLLFGGRSRRGQAGSRRAGEMIDCRFGRDAVAHTRQLGEANAQVAVRATRQRLVEQPGFEQHAQSTDQVAALDAGIARQEIRRLKALRRHRQARSGALFDPPERRRNHVQTEGPGGLQAYLQVMRLPPVVVVEDRDKEPLRVAARPKQVIDAGIPRACRALRAPVA